MHATDLRRAIRSVVNFSGVFTTVPRSRKDLKWFQAGWTGLETVHLSSRYSVTALNHSTSDPGSDGSVVRSVVDCKEWSYADLARFRHSRVSRGRQSGSWRRRLGASATVRCFALPKCSERRSRG